ncbi:MAG: uroporphyrinogen decarboxylase family protein [Candidatus Bathyarchaeia archaeon]
MGYDRALSTLYLEDCDRVGQVEFISHTDFIAKVSGLNPIQYPEEARARAYDRLDLDMIWFTYTPLEDSIGRWYRGMERRGDSWSQAYPTEWRILSVSSLDEIYDFDPFEAWDILGIDGFIEDFERVYSRVRSIYKGQLVPGGTYHTCLMWLIKMFGLDWTVRAAYTDPRSFEKLLDKFGRLSLLEARAWSKIGIEAFISHDDICYTRGPFFPISWMRRYLFPWYKRIWSELRSKNIIVLFCSDGDITSIVDDIVYAGADGFIVEECSDLNVIAGRYGGDRVIVGGVDIGILTYGTIDDVVREVKRCLRVAGPYPGYFINISGSIPDNVPIVNLEAYFRAARKYGLKPVKNL